MDLYIYRIFDAPGPELHGRLGYFIGTMACTNCLGLETPKEAPVIDPQLDIRVKMACWSTVGRAARSRVPRPYGQPALFVSGADTVGKLSLEGCTISHHRGGEIELSPAETPPTLPW